ncbi:fatty acid elongation protein, GNS1/SUR4 family, putative [Plasmodium vinckei petteri]|uniref:Elongation of fatty acids protein n=1 Tax=Plasmodium vinckei petteri TaxID=138298 RepID=A0A6V7SEJ2_PLAVN|nr:fatty acid elongation protein, GNS1/SUR4 family, putative [Plasmodium vinckei petteri]
MGTNVMIKTNENGIFQIIENIRNYPQTPVFTVEDKFPILNYFTFSWERQFTPFGFIKFVHEKYFIAPAFVLIYILICKYGHTFMKNKKEIKLKWIIIIWNFLLFFFNMIVAIKLLPVFIYIVNNYTINGLLTIPPIYVCGFGSVGLWICLFIISKYAELVDTIFLILKKKKITLLHWYHHSTVLLYTWDTYFVELPAGFIFILINAFVHTFMYFYYLLATIYNKPLKWNILVTIIQILQMICGIVLTIYCLYISYIYKYNNNWNINLIQELGNNFSFQHGHYISQKNIFFACLMYLSYFYLFTKYFLNRYTSGIQKDSLLQKKKT